jgi:hypothetical protein
VKPVAAMTILLQRGIFPNSSDKWQFLLILRGLIAHYVALRHSIGRNRFGGRAGYHAARCAPPNSISIFPPN